MKLDSTGDFVWAKSIGGTGNDLGNSIILDSNANVYATGFFGATTDPNGVDFDLGAGTYYLTSSGLNDAFVSEFDKDGNYVWAKAMGGASGNDSGGSIALDSSGNVYITGIFISTTADFDPGAGTYNLTSNGAGDTYISKLDSSGNFVWAKSFGGTGDDMGKSIAVDSSGVYTTGYFYTTTDPNGVDFDPGAGTYYLISKGGNDIFISKLDLSGNFVWAKSIGGNDSTTTHDDTGFSIALDSNHDVYTAGTFYITASGPNVVDFDPGAGTYNLTSAGGADIFLLKLIPTDITPDVYTFTDQTNASLNTEYESNTITVAGINNTADISISSCTGTVCEYSINAGTYTSVAGTVENGDTVKVHQTSSAINNTATDLVLDLEEVTDTFSLTTVVDTPTNLSATSNLTSVSLTVDDFPNDTEGSSGYYFSRSGANSTWIQTNSWQDTGLTCGTSYDYSVIYRNGDEVETDPISITKSTSACIISYTLTYTPGTHGTITGTSPQTVNSGADGTEVTAVPDTGYHFTSWDDGVLTAARTETNVTANHSPTASFAIDAVAVANNTSGSSVQSRVNSLLSMGNKIAADELMKQYPNMFQRATQTTTSITTTVSTISEIQKVTKDLKLGMTNKDVKTLQLFLINQNKGPNAKALALYNGTTYFGKFTRNALAEWQKANKITPSAGYFGRITRGKIKLLNL